MISISGVFLPTRSTADLGEEKHGWLDRVDSGHHVSAGYTWCVSVWQNNYCEYHTPPGSETAHTIGNIK